MSTRYLLALASCASLSLAACGGSSSSGEGGGGSVASSSTGDLATSSSSSSSSTSATGTGGGSSTSTSATGSGGATSSTTGSGGAGTGGTGGAGTGGAAPAPDANHLIISELGVQPTDGEFIEIYNPTSAAVDLSKYYVSDNATYYTIAAGTAWAPVTSNPGTDFLVGFPSGTMIAAGGVITIASDAAKFFAHFAVCPDFTLGTADVTCTATTKAKAVVVPTNGGLTAGTSGLSNDREMVMLFTWDGTVGSKVKDVDYVTWGDTFDVGASRADKTAVSGYAADTAAASQKGAPAPGLFASIERCSIGETSEKQTGGNGITGHDETSEDFSKSFKVQATPTPGKKNTCLP